MAALLVLGGCETLSEDQCRKADWYRIGVDDGNWGRNETWVDAHRRACAKINVAPDERSWRRGWAEGVKTYCVPRRAWSSGLAGSSYDGACKDHNESLFVRYHEAGKAAYQTRKERDSINSQINEAEKELKKAEKDDVRRTLREKIRRLDSEHQRLGRQLDRQLREEPI